MFFGGQYGFLPGWYGCLATQGDGGGGAEPPRGQQKKSAALNQINGKILQDGTESGVQIVIFGWNVPFCLRLVGLKRHLLDYFTLFQ